MYTVYFDYNLGQNISRQVTFHPFPLPQCCKFRKTFGFWTFLQATTATTTLQEGEAGISHLSGNYCPRLSETERNIKTILYTASHFNINKYMYVYAYIFMRAFSRFSHCHPPF
jgi:hypothetical protein